MKYKKDRFALDIKDDPTWVLDPDDYCPMKKTTIELSIKTEAQHDGHPWPDDFCDKLEEQMADELISLLSAEIRELVKKASPYACHKFSTYN